LVYNQVTDHKRDIDTEMPALLEAYSVSASLDLVRIRCPRNTSFVGSKTDAIFHIIQELKLKIAGFTLKLGDLIRQATWLEAKIREDGMNTSGKGGSKLTHRYSSLTVETVGLFETVPEILGCLREYKADAIKSSSKITVGNKENLPRSLRLLLRVMKGAILLDSLILVKDVTDAQLQEGFLQFQTMYQCLKIEETYSGREARVEAVRSTHEDTPVIAVRHLASSKSLVSSNSSASSNNSASSNSSASILTTHPTSHTLHKEGTSSSVDETYNPHFYMLADETGEEYYFSGEDD
jgi:hypothetical protein